MIFLDFVNVGSDWRHLHVDPLRQQSAKNSNDLYVLSVILLQIVMVSPGTHLVENHESLPKPNEFQLKKKQGVQLKMCGPLCNQLETNAKTLY